MLTDKNTIPEDRIFLIRSVKAYTLFGCEVTTTMNQCNVTATDQMTDGAISISKNFHRFQFHSNQLTGASTDGFLLDTLKHSF